MLVHSSECSADGGVEVILDGVVSSSGKFPCDVFPLVADPGMCLEKGGILQRFPGRFGDEWREMVIPTT